MATKKPMKKGTKLGAVKPLVRKAGGEHVEKP